DPDRASRIEGGDAVVNVHHVGRFDEGVVEILVGGIERVVDLERARALGEVAADENVALEVCGVIPPAAAGIHSIDTTSLRAVGDEISAVGRDAGRRRVAAIHRGTRGAGGDGRDGVIAVAVITHVKGCGGSGRADAHADARAVECDNAVVNINYAAQHEGIAHVDLCEGADGRGVRVCSLLRPPEGSRVPHGRVIGPGYGI